VLLRRVATLEQEVQALEEDTRKAREVVGRSCEASRVSCTLGYV
jgi:hypothetical protein